MSNAKALLPEAMEATSSVTSARAVWRQALQKESVKAKAAAISGRRFMGDPPGGNDRTNLLYRYIGRWVRKNVTQLRLLYRGHPWFLQGNGCKAPWTGHASTHRQ